jgi:hypothetical protein
MMPTAFKRRGTRRTSSENFHISEGRSSTHRSRAGQQGITKGAAADGNFKYHFSRLALYAGQWPRTSDKSFGGIMAIKFMQTLDRSDDSLRFQLIERLKVYLFGTIVLFASFGMGEAVYRVLFSDFDGAKDRIPIEALFGLVFALLATKFVGDVYRNRKERRARLNFIWDRNHQIRGALEGIAPTAHPAKNQQSIRVIREEVDRIEWALKEILPR